MSNSSHPIFYAYVKHVESNITLIGVFPTRFVANEWWRAVSDRDSPLRDNVSRITPQFYTQKHLSDVTSSLADTGCAAKFKDRVLFELANGSAGTTPFNLIPSDYSKDLLSNRTYYVRSRSNPSEYWYDAPSGLCVSRTERTLFVIERLSHNTDHTVMIGSDEIGIWVGAWPSGRNLGVEDAAPDKAGRKERVVRKGDGDATFKLEQFLEDGFYAERGETPQILVKKLGQGEAWELV